MSTVISLCDYTGNFVRPWFQAGDCHRNDDLCEGESCWVCTSDFTDPGPNDPDDDPNADERPDYDY